MMKRANKNRHQSVSWRMQFGLLLTAMWLVSFLQPCLTAAGGNVYASFSENNQVFQQEPAGDDQYREAGCNGNQQGFESCPTGNFESVNCSLGDFSCCSKPLSYINNLTDQLDSEDFKHKLDSPGFPALFSLENQTEPAKQFSLNLPELFPPGPSVQSKYRVYLK